MTIPEAFAIALQHHQSGRLGEAEQIYRQILAVEPLHADSLHFVGVIALQLGRSELAVEWIGKAVQQNPNEPNYYSNLGAASLDAGHLEEAIAACRTAIRLRPGFADAHSNLGNALWTRGHLEEAIAACRTAIRLKPEFAKAHNNLGNALRTQGHMDEAIDAYRSAIRFQPGFAEAHSNLGVALAELGQFKEATAAARQAIALKPDYAAASYNLGNALRALGQLPEAIAAYQRTLQLKPDFLEAHVNLGNAFKDEGRFDEAMDAYRRAIEIKPDFAEAHFNLGNAHKDEGRIDEAIAGYRRALQLKPDFVEPHSSLLMSLHYLPRLDPPTIFSEHVRWSQSHAEPLAECIQVHRNDRDPERRLRVGYVSPDFREHASAFFLEGLLAAHAPAQVEVFCYADQQRDDGFTDRFRRYAGQWRRIAGMKDEPVAELIRRDAIDILVDLAGHTADNRLLVFARKPAPVQVTWLGYCDTTGMKAMDYRVTDAFADPPGTTGHLHSEELVRLPDVFACFRPVKDAPPVNALPAMSAGHVTFASFHKPAKLNGPLLELWARVLVEVPDSRLLMTGTGLNADSRQGRLREFFGGKGIDAGRIEFKGLQSLAQYLALHHEVDVLLDSHPFTGHTVGCHALWMGVPVVTLAGGTHCSRMVGSVLDTLGMPEWIARSPEEYVKLACAAAGDLHRLAHLRATLRERMQNSPLTDAPRFARGIESAYREMWRAWCAREIR